MTFRRAVSFACLGGFLILGAWVYVRAQSPRKPAAARAPAGADHPHNMLQPMPPARYLNPAPAGTPGTIAPASASSRPSLAPGELQPAKQIPARVELTSGLALTGTLAAEPLACHAAFGPTSLPLGTIRGIRLHETESAADEPESPQAASLPASRDWLNLQTHGTFGPASTIPAAAADTPAGPTATVILTNGDSLTVALQGELLQLKTDWGVASIEVSHIRSILLPERSGAGEGAGDVTHEWQQHDGRWQLIRIEDAPADAPAENASEPAENIPSLPHYESGTTAPELPDLTPPASSTPDVQLPADNAPSLLPPRSAEPTEASDAGDPNAAPSLEPA